MSQEVGIEGLNWNCGDLRRKERMGGLGGVCVFLKWLPSYKSMSPSRFESCV